jgi:ribulose-bisphosphate carboxylase small chain
MKVSQGQFSFLPWLTDREITRQVEYALNNGWAVAIEYTKDPHPRNAYWNMWSHPMFDLRDPAGVLMELKACRAEHSDEYIKIMAFDSKKGWENVRMSYIVNRPEFEPGFRISPPRSRRPHPNRSYGASQPPPALKGQKFFGSFFQKRTAYFLVKKTVRHENGRKKRPCQT